jgi:DNA-binding FadR family transcriptional regulator
MQYAVVNDRLGDDEDFAFHQAISDATHNPHFSELNEFLEHGVRRLIRQARSNTASHHIDLLQAVQDEHQKIFDAISAGDSAAASLAAESHLRNAAARLDAYSSELPAPPLTSPSGAVKRTRAKK